MPPVTYFVSFRYDGNNEGFGNAMIEVKTRITTSAHIDWVEKCISDKTNIPQKDIVMLNYVLMTEEETSVSDLGVRPQ